MEKRKAVIEAVSGAFPTILTSGSIMALAGFLIGMRVSDPLIATLGTCLGRGVIISIASVMIALPAMLYLFDTPVSKMKFKERERKPRRFAFRKKQETAVEVMENEENR